MENLSLPDSGQTSMKLIITSYDADRIYMVVPLKTSLVNQCKMFLALYIVQFCILLNIYSRVERNAAMD